MSETATTNKNHLMDRIRGSLIGGAAGDALGYPVEFMGSGEILVRYGREGITRFELDHSGFALVSDDTQMTLFTANGLLNARKQGISLKYGIARAYIEWYLTQTGQRSPNFKECWISDIPELNHRRAPGTTCMSSLSDLFYGKDPYNNSKGCGGVMRIAPIPLYAAVNGRMTVQEAALLAGDAAGITHQHPLGFIPAALAAYIIYRLALDERPARQLLEKYICDGMASIATLYPQHAAAVKYMGELCDKAVSLANGTGPDMANVESLGGGWVGDEALAIALYCAVKHFDSFEKAMIAAVNHSGDSDSTGAVCGNILGAAIGYEAIPQFFKDDLEMHDLILHIADDLYRGEVTKID
jgi:ADP-ribosylglycohydrolase